MIGCPMLELKVEQVNIFNQTVVTFVFGLPSVTVCEKPFLPPISILIRPLTP